MGPLKYARALLPLSPTKVALLHRFNWYRNIAGGWTHPHCLDYMTKSEISVMSLERLEFALQHGSQAPYIEPNR